MIDELLLYYVLAFAAELSYGFVVLMKVSLNVVFQWLLAVLNRRQI